MTTERLYSREELFAKRFHEQEISEDKAASKLLEKRIKCDRKREELELDRWLREPLDQPKRRSKKK